MIKIRKMPLLIMILIMGIGIGVMANSWWSDDHQKNDDISNTSKNEPNDNWQPGIKPSNSDIIALPILGTSDRLTAKQWNDMVIWRQQAVKLASENQGLLFINGSDKTKKVALTFDDGPDAGITPQVLNILKEYQVPATFFLKGNQVLKYRSLVQRIQAQGCLVESHAYSHQELNKMNKEDIKRELVATDKAFMKVIGGKPGLIRPPFGAINNDVLTAARSDNQTIVLWSIDTLDWSQQEPEHITENVMTNVRSGDIILLHSRTGQEATVKALPEIIKGLRLQGFTLVNVADLLGVQPYAK